MRNHTQLHPENIIPYDFNFHTYLIVPRGTLLGTHYTPSYYHLPGDINVVVVVNLHLQTLLPPQVSGVHSCGVKNAKQNALIINIVVEKPKLIVPVAAL